MHDEREGEGDVGIYFHDLDEYAIEIYNMKE